MSLKTHSAWRNHNDDGTGENARRWHGSGLNETLLVMVKVRWGTEYSTNWPMVKAWQNLKDRAN